MKTVSPLHEQLVELVNQFGAQAVDSELKRLSGEITGECTILVNKGLHTFPEHLFRGDVFVVYEGSIDLSSSSSIYEFVSGRLIALKKFLDSKKWRQINIIISGHAAICMQVKLAVYRITHIESTDWVFDGAGNYLPLHIPLRQVLSSNAAAEP